MISIEINNIEQLIKGLDKVDLKRGINTAIKKSIFLLERNAKINTPVDTGLLRNSYETGFKDLVGNLRNYREYAPYVEAKQLFIEKSITESLNDIQGIFDTEITDLVAKI